MHRTGALLVAIRIRSPRRGHTRIAADLPLWCLRAVLRLVIREPRWRERYEPLLAAHLAEHEQVAALDGSLERYQAITAGVLLLGGSRNPSTLAARPVDMLHQTIPAAEVEIIRGLDHLAPDKALEVGRRILAYLSAHTWPVDG